MYKKMKLNKFFQISYFLLVFSFITCFPNIILRNNTGNTISIVLFANSENPKIYFLTDSQEFSIDLESEAITLNFKLGRSATIHSFLLYRRKLIDISSWNDDIYEVTKQREEDGSLNLIFTNVDKKEFPFKRSGYEMWECSRCSSRKR